MDAPHPRRRTPFWLRGLILVVLLWLGVRIVGNVTETLTAMVAGGPPAPMAVSTR